MTDSLLYQLSAAKFALWEIHLYLDTHPCDEKAKMLFNEYSVKAEKLKNEYERMHGPLMSTGGYGEKWTKEPWPWQNECNCGGDK